MFILWDVYEKLDHLDIFPFYSRLRYWQPSNVIRLKASALSIIIINLGLSISSIIDGFLELSWHNPNQTQTCCNTLQAEVTASER